jgi:hypothetical protein
VRLPSTKGMRGRRRMIWLLTGEDMGLFGFPDRIRSEWVFHCGRRGHAG